MVHRPLKPLTLTLSQREREQKLRLRPHALELSLMYMGTGVDSPASLAGELAVRSTKPVATRYARTARGRDRLAGCPRHAWSSIRFVTECRSDHGSKRSYHNPVR